MTKPLRLRAQDDDDLKVVSACLQDAIVPIGDMCYLPDEKRFVLVANRFKWETADQPPPGPTADDDDILAFERTHTGLRVENVQAAKLRGINLKDRTQILELLSLEAVEGGVALHFAGGGCIRLDGANWQCFVEDMGEPWPTTCRPCHPLEE
ncbi:DUF2948 family protein [Azospirillum sp. SYSU D00513]|uniref:DUF2948 family protein n=1 Tax=Azospirillum sp. SYSU D00513 TaxID=2812561 RepID=UPI001A95E216|nr:DUF2948 family protein [Azospirillum sp. SYSU D00513]